MRTLSRCISVTILVVLLVAGSFVGFSRPVAAAGPVSIAIMGPFTGGAASVGTEPRLTGLDGVVTSKTCNVLPLVLATYT